MASIVRHARTDIKDFETSPSASSCSYSPFDKGGVINAAAYRAFLLTRASRDFSDDSHWRVAERNLNFVLENQNADGSWPYAVDGVRGFVDHFHTCFVMKALAKIHSLTGHPATLEALTRGVDYYLGNLFAADGLPRPFSVAPRLTVYKRELYDCAESINLCLLLRDRFPAAGRDSGDCRCRHPSGLDPGRRLVPRPSVAFRLGQRSHASLGPVPDVSEPRRPAGGGKGGAFLVLGSWFLV